MAKNVKYFSLSSILLYPKEKWSFVTIARAVIILILFLNAVVTPLSYKELDYTLFQSALIFVADMAVVLVLLPKFNLWLEEGYKIKLSNGIKAIIIIAILLIIGFILPS